MACARESGACPYTVVWTVGSVLSRQRIWEDVLLFVMHRACVVIAFVPASDCRCTDGLYVDSGACGGGLGVAGRGGVGGDAVGGGGGASVGGSREVSVWREATVECVLWGGDGVCVAVVVLFLGFGRGGGGGGGPGEGGTGEGTDGKEEKWYGPEENEEMIYITTK